MGAARFRRYLFAFERNDANAVRLRLFRVRTGQRHFREPIGVWVDRDVAAVRIAQIFVVERGEGAEIAERRTGNCLRRQRGRRLSERGIARRKKTKRKERNERRRARLASEREKRTFATIDGRKPRVVDRVKIGGRAGVKPHSFRTFAMRPKNNTVAVGALRENVERGAALSRSLRKETTLGKDTAQKRLRQVEFSLFFKKRRSREKYLKLEKKNDANSALRYW